MIEYLIEEEKVPSFVVYLRIDCLSYQVSGVFFDVPVQELYLLHAIVKYWVVMCTSNWIAIIVLESFRYTSGFEVVAMRKHDL
jgi:hypothetical protein